MLCFAKGETVQTLKTIQLSNFITKHKLAAILSIGVVVRLILMPITAHPGDMYVWYMLSDKIVSNGPLSVSLFPPINNYFMLIPFSYAYDWLSVIFSV